MTKSVCIVGAGPSGLAAAKALLYDVAPGTFKVTIFEAQSRLGGLWPTKKDDIDGLVHPLMIANQSRHTVQFSDLAWDESIPQFPRAWQVGEYLERYFQRYSGADLQLETKVVKTEQQNGGTWKVETESPSGSRTSVFDYLMVTTGFFGKPIWPETVPQSSEVPIIHSSKYRDLKSLLPNGSGKGGKILVVGGQMSGIEISGTIASHLSSAAHSSGEKPIENPDLYSIQHVIHRPSWIFPLFTSPKADLAAAPFLPCDLPSYNLAVRPHPLFNTQGHISEDSAKMFNGVFNSVLGTDQEEFSPALALKSETFDQKPYLAMSPLYTEFLRSGLIQVSRGKFVSLGGTTATLDSEEQVSDIAAVILATGFAPGPSISFLPSTVLETLSFAPEDPVIPIALGFHGTGHPSISNLGFVGFYRSPYWGVMEMQARFLAHLWSTSEPSPTIKKALEADDSIARSLALRADPRISQFPMGDYSWLMQEFAKALDLQISPPRETPKLANGAGMDILTPARYTVANISDEQRQEVEKNLASTNSTALAGLSSAKFVAGAVFRSLLGTWKLERDLISSLPSHPSGRFVGTAKFLLREGTPEGREASFKRLADPGLEYLYIEEGDFRADNGMTFRATRRYVWRYDEANDKLSVWFTQTDHQLKADYLFHEVEFIVPKDSGDQDKTKGWEAKASHLCVQDLYDVHYDFNFKAVNLKDWRLQYSVKGPRKDYTIDGTYRR